MNMNQFNQIVNAIFNIQIWGLFKVFIVAGVFIYVLFSLVIVRQVELMTEVLRGTLTPGIKIAALAHLVFSLLVLLLAIIIL